MWSRILVPLAAFAITAGVAFHAAQSQDPRVAELAGTYRNVSPDGGRAAIEEGTDEALDDAGRIVRAMARPRILANNPPVQKLVLDVEGEDVRVAYDQDRSYEGTIGGAPTKEQAPDGSDVKVRYVVDGDSLVEIAEARNGSARMRYTPAGDGIVVHTVIESDRLPEPVRFVTRFERAG